MEAHVERRGGERKRKKKIRWAKPMRLRQEKITVAQLREEKRDVHMHVLVDLSNKQCTCERSVSKICEQFKW